MTYDLIVRGGRVIDPSQGLDETADVAVKDGRIAAIGPSVSDGAEAEKVIDAVGKLVTPGLVDLHTHCYWGGTPTSINPDKVAPSTGVTSWVDTGSAGAGNFEGFLYHVIERSAVNIFPLLHVSHVGVLVTTGLYVKTGELFDFRFLNLHETIRVGEKFRDSIYGIKVRASINATGPHSIDALKIGRAAADALEVPLMVHVGPPPPFIEDTLEFMKEGDIVTHAFTPYHGGVVDHRFNIKPAVREARERGVLFDMAHGSGSFSFKVAEAALDQGFPPDVISTDLHSKNILGPVYDMPTTMSKFLMLGMDLTEVVARSTVEPAKAVKVPVGTLQTDAAADIAILRLEDGEFEFRDSPGLLRHATKRLVAETTILRGTALTPIEDDRVEELESRDFPLSRMQD